MRSGAVTFKGHPLTLAGKAIEIGKPAPAFTLHRYEGGMKELTLASLRGKPVLLSVVPSLDTGVCAIQTKKFNDELAALGDQVHAVTVSLDLPFAMNRFCGAEGIKNMQVGSDYQSRGFGESWGLLIDELKILTRAVYVLDREGVVKYGQVCSEVTSEPDYAPAMAALKALV
jgi:thiol peroxidase